MKGQTMQTETKAENLSDLSSDILATSQDLNAILASGGIKKLVMSHYVDTAKELAGIEQLLVAILTENGAVFPKDSHLTAMRRIVIGGSMTLKAIESEVRKAFGFERYPQSTLRTYLCRELKNKVCSVKLSKNEATYKTRPCRKYYLAE
jgi:hypothetical protein